MRRLRLGEAIALISGITLIVMLFLAWYDVPAFATDARTGGWAAMGVLISVLLGLAALLGIALGVLTVIRRSPALPVAIGVLTWVMGSIVWIVLFLRLSIEPALGAELNATQVTLRWPGYVGLLAATLIPIGGLLAIRDERRDAPESAYTPPPPRPIPEPAVADGSGTADS